MEVSTGGLVMRNEEMEERQTREGSCVDEAVEMLRLLRGLSIYRRGRVESGVGACLRPLP